MESVTSISELRTTNGQSSPVINVLGYFAPNDGGGGLFYWDGTSSDAENYGTIIKSGLAGINGSWKREYSGAINVAWFGAVISLTDHTINIQRAIDSIAVSSSGEIIFPPANYFISSLTFGNRLIIIDGSGASVFCTGSSGYAIYIINTVSIANLKFINTEAVQSLFNISGIKHSFSKIQVSGIFQNVFDCFGIKESHFNEIRVDNDVSGYNGNIFNFNYCVNCTVSQSMIGFCENAFHFTSVSDPTNHNYSEGIVISDCITVFANKAITIDNGTFISIIGNVLDFCRDHGIFQSNGQSLVVNGNWIAGRSVNGFVGIGALAQVNSGSISANHIQSGALPISGVAFSIGSSNFVVNGNVITGLDGGNITHPTSQIYGNSFSNGNSGITNVNGRMLINGAITTVAYNMPSSMPVNAVYSDCGYSMTLQGSAIAYRAGVRYKRGNFADLMYQSFYVPLGGGAETEVFQMNAGSVGLPTQAWNGNKFQLGNYILWVDANGRLRIKDGAPTSDLDGIVVGSQS